MGKLWARGLARGASVFRRLQAWVLSSADVVSLRRRGYAHLMVTTGSQSSSLCTLVSLVSDTSEEFT